MADEISQIVEVFISRETAQIDTASFDIPLLMVSLPDTIDNSGGSPVSVPADTSLRVRTYTGLTAVGEDFGITSAAYLMAQKLLANDLRPTRFMIGVKNSTETYTEGLQAIIAYEGDWYAIAIDSKVEGDIKEVAAVIQATYRIFVASTADVGVPNPAVTNDIASFLKDGAYDRVVLVYHELAATNHPEVGWMGGQLPEIPGSNTWDFKSASGVQVSKLTATQTNTLDDKRCNYYIRVAGVNIFRRGNSSEGTQIADIIGLDWWRARVQEQIFYRLATRKKLPMTQTGALIVEAEIRSVNNQGIVNNFIADAPAPTVISPDVLSIPEVQRANRVLGDFVVTFRMAGSVGSVIVRATVSY